MLMRTYQVYLTDARGQHWFEPVLAASDAELLAGLRRRIAADEIEEVKVEFQGRVLFTLVR
jgi:hypothetical protein